MAQQVEVLDLLGVGLDSHQGSRQGVEQDTQLGVGLGSLLGVELQEDLVDRQVEDTMSVCTCRCVRV